MARVSGTQQHLWEPPTFCPPEFGGSPISWGCRSRAFTGECHTGGRYSGLWVVSFVSPYPQRSGPEPVSPVHPVCHVPSVAGAVEAFFASRDLAPTSCRTYRQALGPLVEAVGGDRPVTDLDPGRVAAVFEELWAGRAAATWNTRRVAVRAFASWCGERWPLAGDPLAGVEPRRRTVRLREKRCGGCCTKQPPERRRC